MMRRKRIAVLAAALLCGTLWTNVAMAGDAGIPSADSGQRVYDMADLFGASMEADLETEIQEARDDLGFDIVVVTTEDDDGRGTQDYADIFYGEGQFGTGLDRSGILFLIDMDNRELTLSTDGEAIRIFTDSRIQQILDDVYTGAADGDFEASAWAFLDDVKEYGKDGIVSGQYNYDSETGRSSAYKSVRWYEFLLALAAAGFVAGGACLTVKKQYNMEVDDRQRNNLNMAYRAESRFAYDISTDQLVNKYVTSRVIPKESSSSSSGSRSRSGGSSSRRSTTHRSSSGRSHGGGSRKF